MMMMMMMESRDFWDHKKFQMPFRVGRKAMHEERALVVGSENRLDAFQTYAGNKSAGIRLRRDVHLEQGTYIWSKPVMKGTHPSPRDSHSSTAVGSKLYVFGGTDGTSPLDDLFVLDTATNTWGKPDVFGDVPAPREGHSASLIGDNLFVFGGCGKSSDPSEEEYYNDLHVLNTNTFVWKKISTTGVSPIPRDIHTCSSYKNCCIVMGGENSGNAYLYDIHILDTETMAWREVKTTEQGILFFYGGCNEELEALDDMYFLDTEMLREKDPSEPKLSMRKELKRRRQEYRATPFVLDKQRDADKSLVSSHGEFQAHVQPLGEKMFKARVRDVFNYGYTLEASIDGKLFRGLLFSYKPGFAQAVQSYILSYSLMPGRKTSQEETAGRPKGRSKGQPSKEEFKETMDIHTCSSYNY
ncbi:nitrile-specifier protein 5 [Selaginella moellendorffii]|uniref:nitrile-specifier protein 5 n=1 Tax=Selaginella moellendorffii TaxID=88036 RepID=UPI000D1CAB69|nr:nitrile-specifier protein 5 [Selaginella moellendorffii]|eukprot:XP_024523079.1 nitrile-specifier protein 5 [Selaginella moellendorffii]